MTTGSTTTSRPQRDPVGALGRGMTMLLALALPYLGKLEQLQVSASVPLPLVSIIALLIALTAAIKLVRGETRLKRGWGVLAVLFLLVGASGFGIQARGGDALLTVAQVWSALILVAAVAIHYSGQPMERLAVLTAFVLSAFTAALLAAGQASAVPGAESLSRLLGGGQDSWSLLPRANGPMINGEVLAWVLALVLPLAAAGVVVLEGRVRDLAALVIAILWGAMLSTYSLIAPLAAIAGILIVVASRASLRRPYPGIAVALLIGTLFAISNPVLRARWGKNPQPVNMIVRSVTTISETAADDSLYFTVVNPGPMAWPRGFEIGYHILYPSMEGDADATNLMRGGWVSRRIEERIDAGRQIELILPFIGKMDVGFISPDLRNGDDLLSTEKGLTYVFAYRANDRQGTKNLDALMPVQQSDYVLAVYRSIHRGQERKPERDREEVLQDAFTVMQARPLFGLGPGATTGLLGYDSRSLFIEAGVSYGWVGLALLFLVLAALNIGLLGRGTLEATALSGVLLTAAIHGISAYVHYDLSVVALTAILTGLAWATAFGPVTEEE